MSRASVCRRLFSISLDGWFCRTAPSIVCVPVRANHSWVLTRRRRELYEHVPRFPTVMQKRGVKPKAGTTKKKAVEPKELPPLDPTVVNGVNILKTGSDPPLKPDSEYPDWLWDLMGVAGTPKKPSELPQGSKEYWKRYNKTKAHERNELQKQLN